MRFGQKEVLEIRFFFKNFMKSNNPKSEEAFRIYIKKYFMKIKELIKDEADTMITQIGADFIKGLCEFSTYKG